MAPVIGLESRRMASISRRQLLQAAGIAAAGAPRSAFAQGRCMTTFGSPACNTTDIKPIFEPTGWKTIALEKITFNVGDYRKEAAFYIALMGWKIQADGRNEAVVDMGGWGTAVFRQTPPDGQPHASVESVSWVIDAWNAKTVEAELKRRGLSPVAENGPMNGFESFWVKDPDGWPVQVCNDKGWAAGSTRSEKLFNQKRPTWGVPAPFASTGWKTVWLDHLSFNVTNYKASASFYMNLLGWAPTYDEGSQHELMIGEVGDIIVRGGNPLDPEFGQTPRRRGVGIDHISFGISPWDTDGVKAALEKRGLRAQIDTSSRHRGPDGTWVPDDIHSAQFKSYHTATPNGYNLQISYVTHDNRLALPNAVNPKRISGG
jgi:catechol 2,3-dioxygenase-like lactoylglutathione lyase family enzyme